MKVFFALLMMALVSACSITDLEVRVPMLLQSGSSSLYAGGQPMVRVDTSTSGFNETWHVMTGNFTPQPDAPKLDFERTRVVTFFLGLRFSSATSFQIQKTQLEAGVLTLFVSVHEPAPGVVVIPTITSSFSSLAFQGLEILEVKVVDANSSALIAQTTQ